MAGDSLGLDGAERLAEKIREYWAGQGKRPVVWVGDDRVGDYVIYVVRSNMVRGLPQ